MKNKGFTLIELTIVIVIISFIVAIGAPLLLSVSESIAFLVTRTALNQAADVALSRMMRETRRLKNDEGVQTAEATQFSFTDLNDNSISYSLSGTDLMRNSDILAGNVEDLTFTYYDDSGSEILAPLVNPQSTDIRRIDISCQFQNGDQIFYYKSQVRPRNLRHLNDKFF